MTCMPLAFENPTHACNSDDVIKWKHFPRYWPFVWGIHRSPVNSPHKGQWRGALMFSLICAWINRWVNNCEAGDLRRYRAHYDRIRITELNTMPVFYLSFYVTISTWTFGMLPIHILISHPYSNINGVISCLPFHMGIVRHLIAKMYLLLIYVEMSDTQLFVKYASALRYSFIKSRSIFHTTFITSYYSIRCICFCCCCCHSGITVALVTTNIHTLSHSV